MRTRVPVPLYNLVARDTVHDIHIPICNTGARVPVACDCNIATLQRVLESIPECTGPYRYSSTGMRNTIPLILIAILYEPVHVVHGIPSSYCNTGMIPHAIYGRMNPMMNPRLAWSVDGNPIVRFIRGILSSSRDRLLLYCNIMQ